MGYHSNPFSNEAYKRIFLPWIQVINQKECLSICHFPKRDQLYRIYQFVKDKSFLKKSIVQHKNVQIIPLDLTALIIDDPQDIEKYISRILKKNKRLVLLVLDADVLLSEKKYLIGYLNSLPHSRNATLIYFFKKNITYEKYTCILASFSTFYQNIHVFPYYEKEDSELFISYLEKIFCTIPSKIKKRIVTACGGSFWLIKQTIRYYCRTKDTVKLFSHDDILIKLKILYEELEPEEQEILKKINLGEKLENKNNPYVKHLIDTKLIVKVGKRYSIAIRLFERVVQEQIVDKNPILINKKNNIVLNGVPIDVFFSKREKRIFSYLVLHKNVLVSREKMALVIWGENTENYSDWALDQMMWRFRKKLVKLHLNPNLIKTVKNKGIIFNQ